MSMLDGLRRSAHLDDAAMAAIVADASLSEGSAPTHPHLDDCAVCRERLAAFERWLTALRDEAVAEADEAFPADRLAAQGTQILRRLEAAETPTRVLAFPRLGQGTATGGMRPQRWIMASAAAGLVVGLAVGQLMNLDGGSRTAPLPRTIESSQPVASQRGGITPIGTAQSEETFLAVLDDSVSTRGVPELRPMDQLTPGGRDYLMESR